MPHPSLPRIPHMKEKSHSKRPLPVPLSANITAPALYIRTRSLKTPQPPSRLLYTRVRYKGRESAVVQKGKRKKKRKGGERVPKGGSTLPCSMRDAFSKQKGDLALLLETWLLGVSLSRELV